MVDLDNIFVWGDQHRSHQNILAFDNRPFTTIEDHDRHLINEVEKLPNDSTLIDLGDFSLGGRRKCEDNFNQYIQQLHGKNISLVYLFGNHDHCIRNLIKYDKYKFPNVSFRDNYTLYVNKQRFVFYHYPVDYWEDSDTGSIMVHGHVHKELTENESMLRFCCSANIINYKPISLNEVLKMAGIKREKYGEAVYRKRHDDK